MPSYVLCLLAFFVGAIPFGLLIGKLKGIDLREKGSGNIGASNAMRQLGKPLGILVFVLDTLKGLLPTLLAHQQALSPEWVVGVGLAAVFLVALPGVGAGGCGGGGGSV